MDNHFLVAYQFSCIVSLMVGLGCTAYGVWRRKDMKAKVNEITQVADVNREALPNGKFTGTWGGYEVHFRIDDKMYLARTDVGIKGFDIPCTVWIQHGEVVVTVDKE